MRPDHTTQDVIDRLEPIAEVGAANHGVAIMFLARLMLSLARRVLVLERTR